MPLTSWEPVHKNLTSNFFKLKKGNNSVIKHAIAMGLGHWTYNYGPKTCVKFQVNTFIGCTDRTCKKNHTKEYYKFEKGNNSLKIHAIVMPQCQHQGE